MTTLTDTDAWCNLIEGALCDDSDAGWTAAAAAGDELLLPTDTDEALRQAERLAGILDRVRQRHGEVHDELEEVSEERRQLLVHARAVTRYATSEGGGPIDRLLRMMWVG